MENKAHQDPNSRYYNLVKHWMTSFIPEGPNAILDLGCATGRLGRILKEQRKANIMVGVEIFEPAAEEASKYYDHVYCGDIEALNLKYDAYFDYVICGDIIEHLRDPWAVLRNIHYWMKDSGQLIITIPNIRYWRILRDLIFKGKFDYTEDGILDYTHLRMFTRKSFLKILRDLHYYDIKKEMIINGTKQNMFNRITMGIFEEYLGSQVTVIARKTIGKG
jgi:2-polyprenyl-3-methyl-5-hydroxy-6-metoxy-1,4-benzoquinol methylase